MSGDGSFLDTSDLSSLQSLAATGIDTYAQTEADQTNITRMQSGLAPLPLSYYDVNPFATANPTPSGTGALPSSFAPVAAGVSPLFLLLIGLVVVFAMDKK